MNINSHILKLSGRAELPQEIDIGHNYHISMEGSVPKTELHDNEDGTFNRVYTFKPVKIELLDDKGEMLKLKDTRSMSQLFRGRMWKQWQDAHTDMSFDDWYHLLMQRMIQDAEGLAGMYGEDRRV